MTYFWRAIVVIAILLSSLVFFYENRPFSAAEWTADWDGGPDRDSKEYAASISAGEKIAQKRQSMAPYTSLITFAATITFGWILTFVGSRVILPVFAEHKPGGGIRGSE
jgi:hypothetical protein